MTTHTLKVLIKYADAIMDGTKTFEVRKNDPMFCPVCGAAVTDDYR